MKRIALFLLFFIVVLPLNAQIGPLRIAVTSFLPPFVMQGANNQLYGFDIEMMENICRRLKRPCQYQIMSFKDLLNAVQTNQVDVAVSSIIITAERASVVNFSLPYLLSYSSFLGPTKLSEQPFKLELLNNRTIGVQEASLFADIVTALAIKNPTIVKFNQQAEVITALRDGKVDIAVVDTPSARYWQLHSSNMLATLGKPIVYGYGLGIAINKNNVELLAEINKALLAYQNSGQFKKDYDKYLANF